MNKTNSDQIQLSIPNKPEYVSVARLTVTAIANRMGFDIEGIEDIKVAIAEACTNAITHGKNENDNFSVNFIMDEEKLTITVCDHGMGCIVNNIKKPDFNHLNQEKEGGLGIFIIRSLMDDVQITSNHGIGTTITMTKYMGDGY
ncbi:ATP-binding protein [Alkaliphilus hydrothermalis]|uniref:Serine/threonine-protein kinase RsbW n=1 Tax=Alkaliphilus hydrothermalis TaxID=1482730 RepID=A0ABS2NRK7_9FIRM|nr:ATP-binding protein [Alkaliphilus hydrothermalis]MBM7615600.1 serine/threonine-protein kinase RsbW [Alkaliphilus hydrothermalis]